MIQRTTVFLIASLAVALSASAQIPDFNGTWRLNTEESRVISGDGLAGLGHPAPTMLYITQNRRGALVMASRLPGSQTREYVLNGQTWVPAPAPSDGKLLVSSRIRGMSLVSEGATQVDGEMVRVREVLTMDPRGRRITLEVTTTRSYGPETNTLVYDRVGGGSLPDDR